MKTAGGYTVVKFCQGRPVRGSFLGQNGSGQNGMDKMVWTKWYTDKMVLDKIASTKWHGQNGRRRDHPHCCGSETRVDDVILFHCSLFGQNGTDQLLRIKSSINPALIYNMIFSSIPLP